jgi:hypothetical protein
MAISDQIKEILNRMNRRADKAQLGTLIQNLELGVVAEGSISTAELADDAVDNDKLADDAVDTDQIVDDAVDNDKIADDAVDTDQIADGAVENDQLGADAVDGAKIADDAISLEHLDSGLALSNLLLAVSAEDAKTTSVEENVAGLSSAITLANSLKDTVNAHYADAGESGEEHIAADDAIASDDATDLASLITLLSEIQDSYVAHDDDAILGSSWVYHQAQGTERALASESNPTTLATCITVANDIKAKLNLHMADGTAHSNGDSSAEAADDAANGAAILVEDANIESGDLISWAILDDGTNNVTGVSAVAASGGITVTFSGDPGSDAIISYCAFRAAS